jgi:protein-tyrosine-phosphatase
MTQNHLDSILHTWPEAVTRTRLLDPNGTDIDDPFGASSAVYTDCCHTIETHLNTLVCDLFDDQTRPGL